MVPDYYAMLGIDPGADRSTIESALARCQPAWSSGTRNPKTKHTFQSYLDQIPALRQSLLGSPSSRAAYDAELSAARRAEVDQKLDALQKLIRLRAAKGGLTVSDRKLLRDEALKLGLHAEDLDRLAESIPPKPESPIEEEAAEPTVDVLDPVMRRQIRVALDHLRKRDLYDALGLPRDAASEDIAAHADTERQRWMKKTQVTAEKTAWLEVVTLAQSHLIAQGRRARYDRTLVLEAEEALRTSVAFAVKGLTRIDLGTRSVLLDEAAALGIATHRAEAVIEQACRGLGVSTEASAVFDANPSVSATNSIRLLRCRNCAGITEFGRVARSPGLAECRHCGTSLLWACPVCQRTRWVDEPRCACGFKIEHREPLVRHFEAAQQAFRSRDYAAALSHLKRVRELAPKHAGARKGIQRVKDKVAAIDQARSAWEVARAAAKYVAARAAAEVWGRLVDPASPDWRAAWTEVTRRLHDAQSLATLARTKERVDSKAARELFRKSLLIVSDLPEAQSGLDRCPPDPPSDLSAEFVEDRVKLRWSPPPPDGLGPVSFIVLRKLNTAFTHPADGLRIGETTVPEFEDRGVIPGSSVSYAVVSRRRTAESVGAVAVGPMFLLGEILGVRVETRSREVDLSWNPPRGAAEVRVVRKRGGPPTGPQDGERVDSLIDQAHDRNLDQERIYHYGIYAIYRTNDGRAIPSRGVVVQAQPITQVRALDPPVLITELGGHVTLQWVEPARGIVKVVRTLKKFPYAVGTRLAPIQVASLDGVWLELSAPDQAHDKPPGLGICYYTPLTAWGGSTTVGHSVFYSSVSDPSELRATRAAGGQVQLRWRWSPHGNQSLVVYKAGSPPSGPDDPTAHFEVIRESDYTRYGRHTITLPQNGAGPWHAAVYALAEVDGQPITSPGSDPTCRTVVSGSSPEVNVSYSFRRRRLSGRKWQVTFRTEPPGSTIPPTVLVTHPRTVPLAADDGTIAADFPLAQDGASFPLPDGVNLNRTQARIFADPRAEPDGLAPISLRHPEAGMTRV